MKKNEKKFLKKVMSAVTVAMMLLTSLVLVSANPYAGPDLLPIADDIVNLDFNGYSNGTSLSAVSITNGTYSGFKVDRNLGSNVVQDGHLEMSPGEGIINNYNPAFILHSGAGTDANKDPSVSDQEIKSGPFGGTPYTTEFKFKQSTLGTVGQLFRAELFGKVVIGSTNQQSSAIVSIGIIKNGSNYLVRAIGKGTSGAQSYSAPFNLVAGTWYTVKVIIDVPNQKYDCYLNGVLVGRNMVFNGGNFNTYDPNNTYTLTHFNRFFMADAAEVTTCYDDIRIYREPIGRFTIAADDFSKYSADVIYSKTAPASKPSLAGMALDPRLEKQDNVRINSTEGRIEVTPTSTDVSSIYTRLGADTTRKKLVAEFDFTPLGQECGDFYKANLDAGSHYGMILEAKGGKIFARAGKKGAITPQSYAEYVTLLNSFETGKTYSFKVYIDLNKEFSQTVSGLTDENLNKTYTRHGLYDVYIDGKCVGKDIPMNYVCSNTAVAVDIADLGRPLEFNVAKNTNGFYFDNFAAYTDVRETVLSDIMNQVKAIYSSGILTENDTIILPTTAPNGYRVTWVASPINGPVTITDNICTINYGKTEQNVTLIAQVSDTTASPYTITGSIDCTVPPITYEIDVRYTGANGEVNSGPSAGGKLKSVVFRKNKAITKSIDVYAAVYEGNQLTNCEIIQNPESGITNTLDMPLTGTSTVKFFTWSGDGDLVPMRFEQTIITQ